MQGMTIAVRRANVVYDLDFFQRGGRHVPPFVSSGLLGGCFDEFGFMSRPNRGTEEGRTVLGYLDHYARVESGRHIQYPLAVVRACFGRAPTGGVSPGEQDGRAYLNLVDATDYRQELDLLTGVLTTSMDLYGRLEVVTFASQAAPNVMSMRITLRGPAEADGATPARPRAVRPLVVAVECETSACQNRNTAWPVEPTGVSFDLTAGLARIVSTTNCVRTEWAIRCEGVQPRTEGTRLLLEIPDGTCELRFRIRRAGCPDESILDAPYEQLRGDHETVWRDLWETSWVDLPEDRGQRIWIRSKYYLASNFPAVPARPMCPTGPMGNIWGFYFPQDVYYDAENLPRLGHFRRALKAVRYWLEHLEDCKAYCRDVIGVEGAYVPWTPPYQDWETYEREGVVSADSYELHNAAYVAATVRHYHLTTRDKRMLAEFFPLLEEIFRYYANISRRTERGTYDVYHPRARGQDEASSTAGDLRNLLCCQFSAEYAARAYVEAAEVTGLGEPALLAVARDVLGRGYERAALLRPEGFYGTYEGDDRPIGSQKHPVQLNPITFMPMPEYVEGRNGGQAGTDRSGPTPTETAWHRRYDLMGSARQPRTQGWTFGAYTLASARMRSPQEMERDLRLVQPAWAADPAWTQFYEGSWPLGWHRNKAYYFTTSGLYLQAFTDAILQDWRGYVDLFACLLPGWELKSFRFAGLRARGGVEASGRWSCGRFRVTLRPNRAPAPDGRGKARGELPRSIRVCVSRPKANVRAAGQADGPDEFRGGEVVELAFTPRGRAIVLTGEE